MSEGPSLILEDANLSQGQAYMLLKNAHGLRLVVHGPAVGVCEFVSSLAENDWAVSPMFVASNLAQVAEDMAAHRVDGTEVCH